MISGQEGQDGLYPSSLYASTIREKQGYQKLKGDVECDVAIIGGGFSGVATALFLSERGYKVIILEAERIGWGASGRNGGQLVGGFDNNDRVRSRFSPEAQNLVDDVFYRGHEIIHDWSKRYKIASDFRPGQMVVASKRVHISGLRSDFAWYQDHGYGDQVTYYDRDALHDILDTPLYYGGLENRIDGHLHPLNLCLGEARAASDLGARIYEHSTVINILPGRRPRIFTAEGSVQAAQVVIAGNAYHRLNIGLLADSIIPALSYVAATEPIDPKRITQANPRLLAIYDSNNIIDYYRFTSDNRLLFGGRCDYANLGVPPIEPVLRQRMTRVFPQFADLTFDFTWHGHIGVVLNRIPMLGRLPGNLYFLQGYCGHGIGLSHVYAQLVAEAIAGDNERFDHFASIRHFAIPGARRFSNMVLALGMQFYKLRDALPI